MTVQTRIKSAKPVSGILPVGLAGGANVRTPCGPRRVENLRRGDLIVTRKDGLQPLRMIFSRTVTDAEMAADPSLAPILLRQRAVGPMMPQTPLRLASGHRVLVPGYRLGGLEDRDVALVQARDIAGTSDASFVDRSFDRVTYFNLIFDTHQVFTANGLPVESYLPSTANICALDERIRRDMKAHLPETALEGAYPGPEYKLIDDPDYRPDFA
ncbi:MAG: Hint domain-containing protein [Pseudomonadota bacterium]